MKNTHLPKHLKLTIVLNTMYLHNSITFRHLLIDTMHHIRSVLAPNCYNINRHSFYDYYERVEEEIEDLNNGRCVDIQSIKEYATKHNIQLFEPEYFGVNIQS